MMDSIKTCEVCYFNFDTNDRAPRVLSCGHTLCSICLQNILNSATLRKCPVDNLAFSRSQNSLANFPLNFAILKMLEQKKNDTCKTHLDEKLKFICLTDQTKICSECARHEDHKEHRIQKIKALKAKGAKVKRELQETLENIKAYEQEKDDNLEQIRKVFISTIDEQVKEIKSILEEKQLEWVQQMNNLIDADKKHDSEGLVAFKQQIDETIEDITHACQDENGDLMVIDKGARNNDQNLTKRRTQFLKEKSLRVQNKALEAQNSLKEALVNSKTTLKSLKLLTQELVKEIYSVQEESEQLSQEESAEKQKKLNHVKFKSYFDIFEAKGLVIVAKSPQLHEVEISLAELQAIEHIEIQFNRADTLRKDPIPNVLSYIFHGLKNLVELTVFFEPQNFSNDSLSWLGETIQNHTQQLKTISLTLSGCKFNDGSMQILYDMIFSKTTDLLSLDLDLDFCQIVDADLKLVVEALEPFHKNLNYFGIGLKGNVRGITNSGVREVFNSIQSMQALKELQLDLGSLQLSDATFKILGAIVLPNLRSLDSLSLWLNGSPISDEAISSVLKSLPNLKRVVINLSETLLTDKTLEMFIQEMLPRFEALEYFSFDAEGTRISKENLEKIQNISESFEKEIE